MSKEIESYTSKRTYCFPGRPNHHHGLLTIFYNIIYRRERGTRTLNPDSSELPLFKSGSSSNQMLSIFCDSRGIRTPIWSFVATCPIHWTMEPIKNKKPLNFLVQGLSNNFLLKKLWIHKNLPQFTWATRRTWRCTDNCFHITIYIIFYFFVCTKVQTFLI